MKRMIQASLLAAGVVGLSGCLGTLQTQGSAQTGAAKPVDSRACAKNFSIEGSALSLTGKKYKTFAVIAGVPKNEAMSRASKKLAQDGLNIATMDREGGLLVASNKVIAGRGSQDDAQLVATFENEAGGVKVSMRFGTSFGQAASEDGMRENFCGVISAIEGSR